jgi:predicted nucleotidyltransferase
MHPIKISPEDLQIVQSILDTFLPHDEVWAFGSRVTGKARQFSDLDLAIISQKPLDFDNYAALKEALSESSLPFKVDVVDWATISDEFKEIIKQNFIILKKPTK